MKYNNMILSTRRLHFKSCHNFYSYKLAFLFMFLLMFSIAWGQTSDRSISFNSGTAQQPYLSYNHPTLSTIDNGLSVEFFFRIPNRGNLDNEFMNEDKLIIDEKEGSIRIFETLIQFESKNSKYLEVGILTDLQTPETGSYEPGSYLAIRDCGEFQVLMYALNIDNDYSFNGLEKVHQLMLTFNSQGKFRLYKDGSSPFSNPQDVCFEVSKLKQINIGGGTGVYSTTASIDELRVWGTTLDKAYASKSFNKLEEANNNMNEISARYNTRFYVTDDKSRFSAPSQTVNLVDEGDKEGMIGYYDFNDLNKKSIRLSNSIMERESTLALENFPEQKEFAIKNGLSEPFQLKNIYTESIDEEKVFYLIEYDADPEGSDNRYGLKILAEEANSESRTTRLYRADKINLKEATPVPNFPIIIRDLVNAPANMTPELQEQLIPIILFTGKTPDGDVLTWSKETDGTTISPVLFKYTTNHSNNEIELSVHESQVFYIAQTDEYFEFRPYSQVNESLKYHKVTGILKVNPSASDYNISSKWKILKTHFSFYGDAQVKWHLKKGFENEANKIESLNAGHFAWLDNYNKEFFLDEIGEVEDQVVINLENYNMTIEQYGLVVPPYSQFAEEEDRSYTNLLFIPGIFRDESNEVTLSMDADRAFYPLKKLLYLRSGSELYSDESECPNTVRAVLYEGGDPTLATTIDYQELESIELSRSIEEQNFFSFRNESFSLPDNETLWLRIRSSNENPLCDAIIISISTD